MKSGAAGTVFPLSTEQGEYLHQFLSREAKVASAIDDLAPEGEISPDRASTLVSRFVRDSKVRSFVLKRAGGKCEYCGSLGFLARDGTHYLETHHVIALHREGPDTVENIIALCPADHRRAHFGADAEAIENKMLDTLKRINGKSAVER